MKSTLNHILVSGILLASAFCGSTSLLAGDAPTYRGKVVLVVDKTMSANPTVGPKINRLVTDLVGDGWQVLRHDVDRGPEAPLETADAAGDASQAFWAAQNAHQVREVRAIIEADYGADPTLVKAVFLLGHVAIPYSGDGGPSGGHPDWQGSCAADAFYGEMTLGYGPGWWSDYSVDNRTALTDHTRDGCCGWLGITGYRQLVNFPGDGKFDQDFLPAPMELAVGRVDLYNMPAFNRPGYAYDEYALIAMYLDKDHDFRTGNLVVRRRGWSGSGFISGQVNNPWPAILDSSDFDQHNGTGANWFPYVSQPGNDYLLGYGSGYGGNQGALTIGASLPENPVGANGNNFLETDSRVVFLNLYGSVFGLWDQQDNFLRAPLANPYNPAGGRYGFCLASVWGGLGQDAATGRARALGATYGESVFAQYAGSVHAALIGDPSLRLHTVLPPNSPSVSVVDNTITVNWAASTDGNVSGYNIYRAPTSKGPYTLVNVGGPISGFNYQAARPSSPPDNFYMVRAVKAETTPSGSYVNMSEGVIASVPGAATPYLAILSDPANCAVVANTGDNTANAAGFTVNALGIDSFGSEQLSYQWFKGGQSLSDNSRIEGSSASALLIKGVQTGDAAVYTVTVTSADAVASITSSGGTLSVQATQPPVTDDSYSIVRNTPTDFDVMQNDGDAQIPNTALSLVSISALSDPNAGGITINPDHRTIHFAPAHAWLGPVSFTYIVEYGLGRSQATVTINVIPNSLAVPTISSISDQVVNEGTLVSIPFTVGDNLTLPVDLTVTATSSDQTRIPDANLVVSETGANRILRIYPLPNQSPGTVTITIQAKDDDLATTSTSFHVTTTVANVPVLTAVGFSVGGFDVTAYGPAGSAVEFKATEDFITWTSLGTVTLTGNYAAFTDPSASSSMHRFYSAQGVNGCALNAVGFIKATVPGVNPSTGGGINYIANQLDSTSVNTLNNVILSGAQDQTFLYKWDNLDHVIGEPDTYFAGYGWYPDNVTLNPGESAQIYNPTTTDMTLTFVGQVPQGQAASLVVSSDGLHFDWISSPAPLSGGLDALGFPAQDGDLVFLWDKTTQQLDPPFTFFAGYGWYPGAPSPQVGESFLYFSTSTTPRNWTPSVRICSPECTLNNPSDGSVFVAPAGISLIAAASSDQGIAKVEFYQNGALIPGATVTSAPYQFAWNNVAPGTYTLTAKATDSAGIATISTPAHVTVIPVTAPQLSGSALSGNNFQFTVAGATGASVNVEATEDFITWTSLGNVTLNGGTGAFTDPNAGSYAHRFYNVKHAGLPSVNTVGFVKVTVPGKTSSPNSGLALVANQLNNPSGNTLGVLLPGVPSGTTVQKLNLTTHQLEVVSTFSGGVWSSPNVTLNPGEGAYMQNPNASDLTVTFVGDVPTGQQSLSLPPGLSIASSITPRSVGLDALGLSGNDSDYVERFDRTLQQLNQIYTYFDGYGWYPSAPTPDVGEAFFYYNATGNANNWTQNSSAIALAAGGFSGGNFQLVINGPGGSTVEVKETEDFVSWTSLGTVTLNANGTYNFSDATVGSGTHRFYAVKQGANSSINTVGYVKVTVPGKTSSPNSGLALVANQLNNPSGNTLGVLLPGVPSGTTVQKLNLTTHQLEVVSTFSGGVWSSPNVTLNPGEGAYMQNPNTSDLTVTFVGDVPTGQQSLSLPPGLSIASSITPRSAGLDALGLSGNDSDYVERFDKTLQQLNEIYTYFDGYGWYPSAPTPDVGEAFFYYNATGNANNWTQNLSIVP